MFEITAEDIAQLDDVQLRELVGRLCEADLRSRGYSSAAATWGGDQNAQDGGLDVRVDLPNDKSIDGFIPRPKTGFQVKKPDMPPTAIASEMCPAGALRPVIAELAEVQGAYVIISAQGSTADSALARRRRAMQDAAGTFRDQLVLEFYDRNRLASWVRNFAGLAIWTRRAIGRTIDGWEPFGAWAYPAAGDRAQYLLDDQVRIVERPTRSGTPLTVRSGLEKIRGILSAPRGVVRLVGLSGVGKTRFAQALFDERVGDQALDPALVVYTNMNNDPVPQPLALASDLLANRARTVLVVDNCASDLHSRLSSVARAHDSLLSILTIEYDIREDQPEGTDVFEIQVSSKELIEKLLRSRFPSLSQVDARTAAEFSGGNARIAIALADTVARGGPLGSLNDADLFARLFVQRQSEDKPLLKIAQACALVYSFDGEDLPDGDDGELSRIARLIGASPNDVYAGVSELLRRDLAQRRGKWRAILPHAVANRLAGAALANIPTATILDCLVNGAPERLTKSFSRRLGYLDMSSEAKAIVHKWLDPQGWIGREVWNLNEFEKAIFLNSLPTDPQAGLLALQRNLPTYGVDTPLTAGDYVTSALRSMAWSSELFEGCVRLLETLAIHGDDRSAKRASDIHASLFQLYLSGTHASLKQRLDCVERLLDSNHSTEWGLGLEALRRMLKTDRFMSDYDFDFGAHSRDYGYAPRTNAEQADWYCQTLQLAERLALGTRGPIDQVKGAIAAAFRGLWSGLGLRDELEATAAKFASQEFWREGWLAVRTTRFYDEKNKSSENYQRLSRLETMLAPRDLVEEIRGRVLSAGGPIYDIDEFDPDDPQRFAAGMERKAEEAKTLGALAANDPAALAALMPELVSGRGTRWYFGTGLASGSTDPKGLWDEMVQVFAQTPLENRDTSVFCGFLSEIDRQKSELRDQLLDDALETEPLSLYFPVLQAAVAITPRGMERLRKSIELGKVPISTYGNVLLGRAADSVPPKNIADYLLAIANVPDGEAVAVHLLSMEFMSDRQGSHAHPAELIAAGREMLRQMQFVRSDQREDYHLKIIVEVCLTGEDGYAVAREVCENLKSAVAEHKTYGFSHAEILASLFQAQPRGALDSLLTGDEKSISVGKRLIEQAAHMRKGPLDEIAENALFAWCGEEPATRFPLAASVAPLFTLSFQDEPTGWAPLASRLVHSAPDPLAVMIVCADRLRLQSWGGSRAVLLDANADLLGQFNTRGNAALATFIEIQQQRFRDEARTELDRETRRDSARDERFE